MTFPPISPLHAVLLTAALLPVPALAASWQVDPAKSSLGFEGSQSGQAFTGKFGKFTAAIDFDPANPATGHAVVTIDLASAATGDPQKDEAMPQAEWFDVPDHPQAKFEATTFTATGGNGYEARGSLEIRGMRKDVTLPFTLDVTGDTATAKGRLTLIRTDFGVGQGAWSTDQYVAFNVVVTVDLTATRKP
jgi:polyisoprenoid-binding protein YceI